ncbi:hypothetical protein K440DRAFT_584645, partial [Wilcoxina mikolae CBS 423.85]
MGVWCADGCADGSGRSVDVDSKIRFPPIHHQSLSLSSQSSTLPFAPPHCPLRTVLYCTTLHCTVRTVLCSTVSPSFPLNTSRCCIIIAFSHRSARTTAPTHPPCSTPSHTQPPLVGSYPSRPPPPTTTHLPPTTYHSSYLPYPTYLYFRRRRRFTSRSDTYSISAAATAIAIISDHPIYTSLIQTVQTIYATNNTVMFGYHFQAPPSSSGIRSLPTFVEKFEAGRSFDVEDDFAFIPELCTEEEVCY